MSSAAAPENASATSSETSGLVVVVLAGGTAPSRRQLAWARSGATRVLVVAADSGTDHAHRLGVTVDVAVGDFDSISPEARDWLVRTATPVERHPTGKDASDLELALHAASHHEPDRIVVLGVGGGRLDHLAFNLVVLADRRWTAQVRALAGDTLVTAVTGRAELDGRPGSIVSLLPVGGAATVTTTGLRYRLVDESLAPTSTRGLSNVLEHPPAHVTVTSGTLLAIQPEYGAGRESET